MSPLESIGEVSLSRQQGPSAVFPLREDVALQGNPGFPEMPRLEVWCQVQTLLSICEPPTPVITRGTLGPPGLPFILSRRPRLREGGIAGCSEFGQGPSLASSWLLLDGYWPVSSSDRDGESEK